MKSKTFSLSAPGNTPWWMADTKTTPYSVAVQVDCAGGGTYSYKLQHGYSTDYDSVQTDGLTRAAGVATLVFPSNHGLSVGDSVVVNGSLGQGNTGSTMDGTFDVASVVNLTTITYAVTNSGPTTVFPGCVRVKKIHTIDNTTIPAATAASKEAVITTPVNFFRVVAVTVTTGTLNVTFNQGWNN
jgi:hypothetical protein